MMQYSASYLDQGECHQVLVPIALEVETPKTDEVPELVVYLHSKRTMVYIFLHNTILG